MEQSKLNISLLMLLLMILIGCSTKNSVNYGPQSFYKEGFTAIVVAYEPEMLALLETIEADPTAKIVDEYTFKGIRYRLGTYKERPILIFATGMSIANAAMSIQMALDYFPVDELVYMGIAGAVNPKWQPGDVIVPERWYYHDESVYSNPKLEDDGGYILPEFYISFLKDQKERQIYDPHMPDYKPFHFIHPDDVLIIKDGMEEPSARAYFAATPRLLEAARAAIKKLPPQNILGERFSKLSVGGNGVTGSVFVDNRNYRKWTREVFNAEVTEMESAAVGQVCEINEVDWVIIRSISDLAGGQEGVNDEHIYDVEASRVAAALLFALLDELQIINV